MGSLENMNTEVAFDLLKVFASDAFGREVGTTRRGSGWDALASALGHVRLLGNSDEVELRRRLICAYRHQPPKSVHMIVKAKRDDPLSWFHCARRAWPKWTTQDVWPWYLYCLSFSLTEVEQEFASQPESTICFMPLDLVDLYVVASIFRVQITVTQLIGRTWRLSPADEDEPQVAVHLLLHQVARPPVMYDETRKILCNQIDKSTPLWAPLLGTRPQDAEPINLVGSLVRIGQLPPGPLEFASNKEATIIGHRPEHGNGIYEACIDQVCFLLRRDHIRQVLFHEDQADLAGEDWWEDENPAASTLLVGIPDRSLEFQILSDRVRKKGSCRLEKERQELAGRDVGPASSSGPAVTSEQSASPSATSVAPSVAVPAPAAAAAAAAKAPSIAAAAKAVAAAREHLQQFQQHQFNQQPQTVVAPHPLKLLPRMCLEEAIDGFSKELSLMVITPTEFKGIGDNPAWLPFELQDTIVLHHHDHDNLLLWGRKEDRCGWIPRDKLIIWEAERAFSADEERCLSFGRGELLLVSTRHSGEYEGWAGGSKWPTGPSGLFMTDSLRPTLLLHGSPPRQHRS
eukprot:TRINITY_DN15694_c0_g1_i1.p1 TRINITY_DN15694_c0_g1~~TRINITY_DN15694_c0_g1_i1.p1  ORF type:complete len:572 (-),score=76.02 TRINITY_DN15694_c0_g1_i1:73-1788(-)